MILVLNLGFQTRKARKKLLSFDIVGFQNKYQEIR